MERLVALLKDQGAKPTESGPNAYLLAVGDSAERAALGLAERLRSELPALRLVVDAASGSFRSKMKRADRSTADFALILGEDEAASGTVGLKALRGDAKQATLRTEEATVDSPLATPSCAARTRTAPCRRGAARQQSPPVHDHGHDATIARSPLNRN